MIQAGNDYDTIAGAIDDALAAFTGNAHEPTKNGDDSITVTKDGFITGVIRFQRLRNWVKGLAETRRRTPDTRFKTAINALRVIAMSYRERIDAGDSKPYEYAQAVLNELGIDLEAIPE